jgi:hypothetical protein
MDLNKLKSSDDGVMLLGVFIEFIPPHNHTHAGILYRRDDGQLHRLHLAWHCDLRDEAHQAGQYFAVPDIPPERARFFPRLCQRIKDRAGRLRYALRPPKNARFILDTGEVSNDEKGLNCATFVLAVFNSFGFQLIELEQWPQRPADAQWQTTLVAWLKRKYPDQAALVESDIGCPRPRPEEVAGACLCPSFPVAPNAAIAAGVQVIGVIGGGKIFPPIR